MKKLLFISFLLTVLFELASCDTFKQNDVNPLPTTEVINQAVLDVVKLYYPNASDIKIKVLVPERVWEASFYDGNQVIILNIDNSNKITRVIKGSRQAENVLDVPDKIINYIKAKYSPITNILMFNLLLDKDEKPINYLAYLIGPDGNVKTQEQAMFDIDGNFIEKYSSPSLGVGYISSQQERNLDALPEAIQKFTIDHKINQYKFLTTVTQDNNLSEGSFSITKTVYTSGSVFNILISYPKEAGVKISGAVRRSDRISLKSDGSLIEWYSLRPNSIRGSKNEQITESDINPSLKNKLNDVLGTDNWKLDYGVQQYTWFTKYGQDLNIVLKNEPDAYIYVSADSEGNLREGVLYLQKYKRIKDSQQLPEFMINLLNQQLSGWKFVSGSNNIAAIKISDKTVTTNDNFSIIVSANGKIYSVNTYKDDKTKINIYEMVY